jgi:hypothetical protein
MAPPYDYIHCAKISHKFEKTMNTSSVSGRALILLRYLVVEPEPFTLIGWRKLFKITEE